MENALKIISRIILEVLCAVVFVFAGFQLVRIMSSKADTESAVSNLKEMITESADCTVSSETEIVTGEDGREVFVKQFNEKFRQLYSENNDFVGWITVDGTNIDLPVMQRAGDYYLNHAFEGHADYHGVPFLDTACNAFSSDNLIVYSHNMLDGTMFSELEKFTSPEFCKEKHVITFDTIWDDATWQVVSVFVISTEDTEKFPYHTVTTFSDDGMTLADYLANCKNYALWQDNAPIEGDARLLTLSTCEYTNDNGRLVVVAKRLPAVDEQ